MKEQRPGSGVLFRNDRKETNSHPDYRGEINIDGVPYFLNAWIKTGAKGKFMSLSVKAKTQSAEAQVVDHDGDRPF